jgi:predicted transcriptional regulator/RNA polymerase subunit RPABC4/transcription elongation factor Spt4
MSKITFRADDDLVRRLEEFDASKSEVMREALRNYLDRAERETDGDASGGEGSLDAAVGERIDELIADRLDAHLDQRRRQDVNVNVTLDAPAASGVADAEPEAAGTRRQPADGSRKTPDERVDEGNVGRSCEKCGETLESEHVYCPNCGEKASHRLFCECGDEIRSDWAFCPSCGRRTAAADVLDRT